MKKALAIALAVMFVLSIAVPAFAQSISHTVKEEYVDATIDIERQAGHLCNTGAELKYTVKGSVAEFMAERATTQERYKISVTKDDAAWVAGATPLTVTSVIELCAPAKHEYTTTEHAYALDAIRLAPGTFGWGAAQIDSGVVEVPHGYEFYDWSDKFITPDGNIYPSWAAMVAEQAGITRAAFARLTRAEQLDLEALVVPLYDHVELDAVSSQIWAVQVQSDPGFSGNLEQGWEAAYGPYEGTTALGGAPVLHLDNPWAWDTFRGYTGVLGEWWRSPLYLMTDDVDPATDNSFGFRWTDGTLSVELGPDYVGNYFNIQQHARTSQGTLKRFIDVSSPWSHAYVWEDTTVTGKADVQETFAMGNLGPGADVATDWWELF